MKTLESVGATAVTSYTVFVLGGSDADQLVGAGCLIAPDLVLTFSDVVLTTPPNWSSKDTGKIFVSRPHEKNRLIEAQLMPQQDSFGLCLLKLSEPLSHPDNPGPVFGVTLNYTGKSCATLDVSPELSDPGSLITGTISEGDGPEYLRFLSPDLRTVFTTQKDDSRNRPLSRSNVLSGAPIWSEELEAFVGLVRVVNLQSTECLCLTSGALCRFRPELAVQFRIPHADRPKVTNFAVEDPNQELFPGTSDTDGDRRLTATVAALQNGYYSVKLVYQAMGTDRPPRGRFVTFLTYPDMAEYELVAELDSSGKAEVTCQPFVPDFTVAAIGDGGDTRLTLNLEDITNRPGDSRKDETPEERPTYTFYINDQVPYPNRRQPSELTDALKNKDYARQMAQLICAKLTPMPFSLGLFGDWGSGKSYFIGLLHREIESITSLQETFNAKDGTTRKRNKGNALIEKESKVFYRKVVQIHFNAWHYLDTNLWANLVCEIFDSLFKQLIERDEFPDDKVKELKKKLADESALAAEARKALDDANERRKNAQQDLDKAIHARRDQENAVATFIDTLAKVVGSDLLKKDLQPLAANLGLPRLAESYSELESRALEARTLTGRFRTLALTLFSPKGRTERVVWFIVALAVPPFIAWLLDHYKVELSSVTRFVTTSAALLATITTWISAQTKRGTKLIGQLETAYQNAKTARDAKLKEKPSADAQSALDKCIQAEKEAVQALEDAQAKVRAIEAELQDLAPGRRLLKFLEQRAGANDYRQYLGLVSLVRRDFEKLSELLNDGNDELLNDVQDGTKKEPPVLNRIVLYIDDLDRCKADRVIAVLEAVHLLLAFPIFAVVVAVDPRWLRKSLINEYPTLLSGAKNTNGELPNESRDSVASPQDYLEKIFQVPFQLEPIEKDGFQALVADLLPVKKKDSNPTVTRHPALDGSSQPEAYKENPPVALPDKTGEPAAAPALETGLQSGKPSNQIQNEESEKETVIERVNRLARENLEKNRLEEERLEKEKSESERLEKERVDGVPSERLQLEEWERTAIQSCFPLFRTPRAVKRLANTYCLIRTGFKSDENQTWHQFIGSQDSPGGCRTPLLMLAVAAAYPGLARDWYADLLKNKSWMPAADRYQATAAKGNADWKSLADALALMKADKFAPFDESEIEYWLPKIKRYSF